MKNAALITLKSPIIKIMGSMPIKIETTGLKQNNTGTIIINDTIAIDYSVEYQNNSNECFDVVASSTPYTIEVGGKAISAIVGGNKLFNGIILSDVSVTETRLQMDVILSIVDLKNGNDISEKFKLSISKNLTCTVNSSKKIKVYPVNNSVYENKFLSTSKLSNYYECPNGVFYGGRLYKSSEAAYQSCKTNSPEIRDKFMSLSADDAKNLGRQLEGTNYFRQDWNAVKYVCMRVILISKYTRNPDCYIELMKSQNTMFIEDTTGWHDKVWGKCYCKECNGTGENMLGAMLTNLRAELLAKYGR